MEKKDNKIKDILKRTFPNSKIPQKIRDLKIGDLKEWDSLGNFNLLLEIEKVFKCRIETKSFNKIKSIRDIQEYLKKKWTLKK